VRQAAAVHVAQLVAFDVDDEGGVEAHGCFKFKVSSG
jgi:hypothetical protein